MKIVEEAWLTWVDDTVRNLHNFSYNVKSVCNYFQTLLLIQNISRPETGLPLQNVLVFKLLSVRCSCDTNVRSSCASFAFLRDSKLAAKL